jgi:hypothetical protein
MWFLGKYGVLISWIFYGTFVSGCYIFVGHFWTRSEPFSRTRSQRCNRRLWRKQKCFLPLTRFYTNLHVHILAGAHIHAHRKHINTRTHPRTSTHRKNKNWRRRKMSLLSKEVALCATADSHNYLSRDCGFRPTTRQREARKMYTKAKWIRGRSVFLILLTFSSSPSIDARYWYPYYKLSAHAWDRILTWQRLLKMLLKNIFIDKIVI